MEFDSYVIMKLDEVEATIPKNNDELGTQKNIFKDLSTNTIQSCNIVAPDIQTLIESKSKQFYSKMVLKSVQEYKIR